MPRINEVNCPNERQILLMMRDAVAVRNGYTPHDTPYLTGMLANHRRLCPFCNGTALSQLFGRPVQVVLPQEAGHAA